MTNVFESGMSARPSATRFCRIHDGVRSPASSGFTTLSSRFKFKSLKQSLPCFVLGRAGGWYRYTIMPKMRTYVYFEYLAFQASTKNGSSASKKFFSATRSKVLVGIHSTAVSLSRVMGAESECLHWRKPVRIALITPLSQRLSPLSDSLVPLWQAAVTDAIPRGLRFFGGGNDSLLIHGLESGEM